jgi:hypothetical protein
MPPYHLSRTQTGYPLKEERAQNGTKPKVLVAMLSALCELPLHAVKHDHTPIEYSCI